ncbi:MAG: 1-acyl-sn-glycerol-3-phosphate acyltransferase [Bacteroidia bacterium]|nr:1-acyl-sn-glycerol-3-phosphate acyltransferase [Bacteroidia bacterium]
MKHEPKKYIDIEKVIHSKNPALLKWLPGFALSYVKRILHEKDLNAALNRIGDLKGYDFAKAAIDEIGAKVEWTGLENIPLTEPCIIASNHPLGGLDGIALIVAVHQRRPDFQFLVNDLLMHLDGLKDIWLPVNKHGKTSEEHKRIINNAFSSSQANLIFPAGLVSRKIKGEITDLRWRKGCLTYATKYKRNIVPCYIEGKNSSFFYNLAVWRKRLGINANIEMFFLVNEMFKQKGKKIKITFGKPISHQVFEGHSLDYWTQKLKEHVYAISKAQSLPLPTL